MTEPTDMHGPTDSAPAVTNLYAKCAVCNWQWQVKGQADTKGCSACDAPEEAVTVHYEGPSGAGSTQRGRERGCWVGRG